MGRIGVIWGTLYKVQSELNKLQREYEEIESQLPEYEVTVSGIESQTRSRRVSARITVYAASEEEAVTKVEAMPQDELEFEEIEFYEGADSEIEDVEVADVELIAEGVEDEPEAAAG